MTSYKLSKRHILTKSMKVNSVKNSKKLLSNLKSHKSHLVFFSDKKNWTVDRSYNSQNDRWLARDRADIPHIYTTKFLASVITLGVICSNGKVMPPIFFNPKEREGVTGTVRCCLTQSSPGWRLRLKGAPYIFQQDSAPSHTTIKTQKLLRSKKVTFWAPEMWPPNPPDLNPMDFFFKGELERHVCKDLPQQLGKLEGLHHQEMGHC